MISSSRKSEGSIPAHIASRYRSRHSFDPETGYQTLFAARKKLASLWLLAGGSMAISVIMAAWMIGFVSDDARTVSSWQTWLFAFVIPALFAVMSILVTVNGVRPAEIEEAQAERSVRAFERRYRDFLLSLGLDAGEAAALDDDKTQKLCERLARSYSTAVAAPGTDEVERLRLEAKFAEALSRFRDMGYTPQSGTEI